MSKTQQPRIAIIGAGPGGLSLGLLLHKSGIKSTIYDLRQRPTPEELATPSGMLDMHDESGQATLTACGLEQQFRSLTGECSEMQIVADKDGKVLYTDQGGVNDRPEISRHALTGLLIETLPATGVKWGYKLLSASSFTNEGRTEVMLDFGEKGREMFDLVIGADGAWSRIRKILTDASPYYAGRHNVTLTIRNLTKKYPHLAEFVGQGSFSALGLRHGVMSQRGPQDSARIYCFLSTENERFGETAGIAGRPASNIKDRLFEDDLLGRWGNVIKELVSTACDEDATDHPGESVDIRPMYTLDTGVSWEHKSGATLIGDAAHLMGPWAGEGVNLAMWDSRLLAEAIIKAAKKTEGQDVVSFQNELDPLLRDFEVDMAARAKEKAEETVQNGKMLFGSDDAAEEFAKFFLSFMPPPE